jgi:hypothetical protein
VAKAYDIKYVLLCDDIRQEFNKKLILIGFYANNEIVVPNLPINLASQAFLVALVPRQNSYSGLTFLVKDPHGQEIFRYQGTANFQQTNTVNSVGFPRSPALLMAEGTYQVLFGMGDEKPRRISTFKVIKGPVQ